MKKAKRGELETTLKVKFDVEKLGVFYLNGSDIFVGEVTWGEPSADIKIRNAKRLFRLARMTEQGLETQLFVGDLEVLSPSAIVSIRPAMWYLIKDLDDDSAIELFKLLESYVKAKVEEAARRQGIVTNLGAQMRK